jgi:hypothetical protein
VQLVWSTTGNENPAVWADLITKIKDGILSAFDSAVTHREEEVKRSEGQRQMPGWNFCTFFILKVHRFFLDSADITYKFIHRKASLPLLKVSTCLRMPCNITTNLRLRFIKFSRKRISLGLDHSSPQMLKTIHYLFSQFPRNHIENSFLQTTSPYLIFAYISLLANAPF